ncbi:cell-death-related nuclease 7-like [Crassostrea angulata]|uniref:cell-death-related nuclease 7-like n=1 Tax=Magallana angulata TaxID=2784310 RepID=UPI0022B0B1DF|nr:cell-death-related nuclease 7-like [Crassostrea angulata]
MKQLFLIIGFLGYQSYTHSAINCKNQYGRAVDWFILYKLPMLSSDELKTDGTEFFYMDEDNQNFQKTNAHNITKTNVNPLFETLKPIYAKSPLLQSYAMYNDQPPSGQNAAQAKAHSKGALAFDKKTGFWMISSIPRFPAEASKGYIFSDEQKPFGQIVLCVTVDQKHKKEIDIYTQLISPGLTSEIDVQTWRPDLKNTKKVWNVVYIDFGKGISYKASLDHSKWAVAKHQPFTCIGDLNRQRTQFKRGGLSLCLKNRNVTESFRNLYSDIKKKEMKIK